VALPASVQHGEITMKEQPLISVFLPTYNQQAFIAESIESVLSQDYGDLEIVVGDDCSQDNTWAIVQEYQRNHPDKIKAFRNEQNLGITGNCNEILKCCTGKYIAFTAGDDLCLPGKISKQVEIMERDQSVVLCYHDVEVFNSEDNKTLRYWNQGSSACSPIYGSAEKVAKAVTASGNSFMAAMSVMVQRKAIPLTGFDQRIPHVSDWFMWIEILSGAGRGMRVEYLPEVLARYRRHGSNITSASYGDSDDIMVTLAIAENRYPFLIRSADNCRLKLRYAKGVRLILIGKTKLGRYFLHLSLRSGWVSWKIFYWLAASYIPSLLQLRKSK
jgi:glycosyltransferase involved in cell wall biosynthesis